MHILFLSQIIPYPPDAGPKVKTWHVLRYLAGQGHRITLASLVRPEEIEHVDALRSVCDTVHTVPIRRSRAADVLYWLRSHRTRRPFLVERDNSVEMRRVVAGILREDAVDVIHADQLTMAQFALPPGGGSTTHPAALFDAHNAVWTILERMAVNVPWVLRPPAILESRRIKRYEGWIVRTFEHTLAVTEIDRRGLLRAAESTGAARGEFEDRVSVVPIAVDTQQIRPARPPAASTEIVTLGTLHYPPNADGIRWFLKDVFPRVQQHAPDSRLTIIGKNPPQDFQQAARRSPQSVRVTGYVECLDPFFEAAAAVVIPVRAGGGMRVRILEAFARGLPVVTTTVGLEGIDAISGRDVLVADGASEFADAVLRLLDDPGLREQIGRRGRALVEREYDWNVVLARMGKIYNGLSDFRNLS